MQERMVGTIICGSPSASQLIAIFKHSLYRTENNIRLKLLKVINRALSNFLQAIKAAWDTISHDCCCQWTFPPMLAALALTLRHEPAKTLLVLNFQFKLQETICMMHTHKHRWKHVGHDVHFNSTSDQTRQVWSTLHTHTHTCCYSQYATCRTI